jgi:hypothetical protein
LGDVEESMIQFLRLAMLKEKDAFLLEAVFRRDVRAVAPTEESRIACMGCA